MNQSTNAPLNPSSIQATGQPSKQSTNQSAKQSIRHSFNQAANQTLSQPNNYSIKQMFHQQIKHTTPKETIDKPSKNQTHQPISQRIKQINQASNQTHQNS